MTRKASDILRAAKRLIDAPEKWCKGTTDGQNGSTCMYGALGDAINTAGVADLGNPLMRYLDAACGQAAPLWNDLPTTTHTDILGAFDRAIALAEADETPTVKRESPAAYYARQMRDIANLPASATV